MSLLLLQNECRTRSKTLFRLAPTPNGFLHRGNVYSFLITELNRRYHGGQMLLRLDDLDPERTQDVYFEDVFGVLGYLGLKWGWGPQNLEEAKGKYSQSFRMNEMLDEFWKVYHANPKAFYVCDCSKSDVKQRSPFGVYDSFCLEKDLSFTKENSIRFRVDDETLRTAIGDFVVRRRGGTLSYQWISLREDLHWGVTHIVRGEDLRDSTRAQLELAEKLVDQGQVQVFDTCIRHRKFCETKFLHHPLLVDEAGVKLSKNRKDLSFLDEVRAAGLQRGDVFSEFLNWAFGKHVDLQADADLSDLYDAAMDLGFDSKADLCIPKG